MFVKIFLTAALFESKVADISSGYGAPVSYKDASLTVGKRGPMLLEDTEFIDEIAHFNRERIPERAGHAKGGGAFGYFEVTHNITEYCGAAVFSEIGKRTRIIIRFSTGSGEVGSADTARDARGIAIRFYTEEGNWDLVGNNLPVFFIRDPILFPSFIHAVKRNPSSYLYDPDMMWDFYTLRPEASNVLIRLYSDLGTPDGYRFMHGYGVNTFKLVNTAGDYVYARFNYLTDQGIRNLTAERALQLQATDPDYSIRDLYNSISNGDYPSWTFYIQVMTEAQAVNAPFNPFDDTKVWPPDVYPFVQAGKLVLNENPTNYFAQIEQLALSPSHMVPGIRPSPDKMLQGRLFAYPDTQRHRLGPNFLQIPVNCPLSLHNFQRDGFMTYNNQGNATNYHPNSFNTSTVSERSRILAPPYAVSGNVDKYDSGDEDNFSQASDFYRNSLDATGRANLISNLASAIFLTSAAIRIRMLEWLGNISTDLRNGVEEALKNAESSS